MGAFDISRISFDADKHYSSVRMQQGRVVTDADQIEDESIHAEEQRRIQADIIGTFGSPDEGFRISDAGPVSATDNRVDFKIEKGSVYLGGIRFEMDKTGETYLTQDDWLSRGDEIYSIPELNAGEKRFDLIYLEGWQQYVSAVEDSSLFDVALGGPDTTTRIKNMRRVKAFTDNKFSECALAWNHLKHIWDNKQLGVIDYRHEKVSRINLKVSFTQGDTEDLCSPSVAGGYLGAENQAIRVQIHRKKIGNVIKKYFTWGFDNASPYYKVTVDAATKTVTMLTEPKDQYHWPVPGQIVEILPWSAVLPNGEHIAEEFGFIGSVSNTSSYDPDHNNFVINEIFDLQPINGQESYFMRVWNEMIEFDLTGTYNLGNTGVAIKFNTQNPAGADIVSGDYWIIAVRPETPDKVYPWGLQSGDGMPPFGTRRYYAPLAIIQWMADANGIVSGLVLSDCRRKFHPLTHHDCCCTYSVGDGVTSHGDFNSLQNAIDNLPLAGGKICLLPGIHTTNAKIINRKNIHISGCGKRSIVRQDIENAANRANPVFLIKNSQWICLENMNIITLDGTGVQLDDDRILPASIEIMIRHNFITSLIHAVRVVTSDLEAKAGHHIHIVYNRLYMINEEKGDVAIFTLADDVLIERNRVVIIPYKGGGDGGGGNDGGDDNDDHCECDDKLVLYRRMDHFRKFVYETIDKASRNLSETKTIGGFKAKGGIQIGSGSSKVVVLRNEIFGGAGHGIILGHRNSTIILNLEPGAAPVGSLSSQPSLPDHSLQISNVKIEENTITDMYLSGISSVEPVMGDITGYSLVQVADIEIYRNEIFRCAVKTPPQDPDYLYQPAYGGVSLSMCADVVIRENRIENNGLSISVPVCGIFILYGEKVDISNNLILNNGKNKGERNPALLKGYRGGIFLRMIVKYGNKLRGNEDLPALTRVNTSPSYLLNSTAAVKIHDNVVIQPAGHALIIMAVIGAVSVVSNQFTCQGTDPGNKLSLTASTILIYNLSVSSTASDIPDKTLNRTTSSLPLSAPGTLHTERVAPPVKRLLPLPGKILFTANQTTFAPVVPDFSLCLTSQFIISRDDIAYLSNQSECLPLGSTTKNVRLAQCFLASVTTVRAMNNWLGEGPMVTPFSLISKGFMNTTADNQSTHCVVVAGGRKVDRDNLVIINQDKCKEITKVIAGVLTGSVI